MDALADYTREYQHRIDNPKDPRFRAPQEKANGYADRMINRVGRQAIRRPVELQSFITDASGRGWSPGPELQAMAFAWLATAFFGMLGEITKTLRISRKLGSDFARSRARVSRHRGQPFRALGQAGQRVLLSQG
ncbi:hypothetical protein SBA_ch1_06160 [Sphingomonas bisphenolicum]|uniref:Transposase n=2 Tax=Sphingomonas bisphenolicum TaxID=296544 RepID=A0ABN5WFZ2_9SPHN|nr:hypothetical protein SBA_ch1_06160 [Sphingomonas bisphenolicum]